jgi:O-methyltransferase
MSRLNLQHSGVARRRFAIETLYNPRQPKLAVDGRVSLYRHAAELVGKDRPITYLEFGVADGPSFREMIAEFSHPDTLFVGFDSFIGLPEDWLMHKRGTFSNRGSPPPIDDPRVRFVQGWFQNTLHDSLALLGDRLKGPVLIHYDCDIYYATLFLLSSIWPHCPEYHFIMDDFLLDDIVALHDFSIAFPVEISFLAKAVRPATGADPHQILGKMARTEFSPDRN